MLKGECKATLEPAFLEHAVSVDDLHIIVDHYFGYLDEEEGGTIEWYFDTKSKFEDLGDAYCRLVLKNYLPNVSTSNNTRTKLLAVQRLLMFNYY